MKTGKPFGGQQDKKPGQQHDPRQGQGGTMGGNKPQQNPQKPGQNPEKGQW